MANIDNSVESVAEVKFVNNPDIKFVKWTDYPSHKKYKIWDMLNKIGDEVVVVYGTGGGTGKMGLSRSATEYGNRENKVLKIVYRSAHIVRVRFEGVV